MTSKSWSDMTSREQDLALATLIGDEIKTASSLLDGAPIGLRHYTTSYEDLQILEGKIENRNLHRAYIQELYDMCTAGLFLRRRIEYLGWDGTWMILQLTMQDRCRVAYRVLGGE